MQSRTCCTTHDIVATRERLDCFLTRSRASRPTSRKADAQQGGINSKSKTVIGIYVFPNWRFALCPPFCVAISARYPSFWTRFARPFSEMRPCPPFVECRVFLGEVAIGIGSARRLGASSIGVFVSYLANPVQ